MSYLSTAPAGGAGSGTVTQVNSGVGLTGGPITGVGTLDFATSLQPMATLTGNASKFLRVNAGETAVEYATLTASPAGSDTQVQFNDAGVMAGSANLVFNKTTPYLRVGGAFGSESGMFRVNGTIMSSSGFNIPGLTTLSLNSLYSAATFDIRGYNGTAATPVLQLTNQGTTNLAANFNTSVGINSALPTHSLTLGSTATGVALYNTADQTTNYERVVGAWSGNIFTFAMTKGGTGTDRAVNISSGGMVFSVDGNGTSIARSTSGTALSSGAFRITGTQTQSSGLYSGLGIAPTINQSSTAGYTALLVNPTETTIGSGSKLLADFQVGGVSKFSVSSAGKMIQSASAEAGVPAAGVASGFLNITAGGAYGLIAGVLGSGKAYIQAQRIDASATTYNLQLQPNGGAVEVGSTIELGNASDTTISRSSAGVIAVEGVVIPSVSSTNTLTNKRITPRTGTTTSSATPTINTDDVDFYSLTAQAADITSFTTNLLGTPTDGQKLWIAITGTAARAITWGASFEASTVALPTTTVTTNRLDVGFVWNAVTSKWRCIASG